MLSIQSGSLLASCCCWLRWFLALRAVSGTRFGVCSIFVLGVAGSASPDGVPPAIWRNLGCDLVGWRLGVAADRVLFSCLIL
jgi:hypothetical protein